MSEDKKKEETTPESTDAKATEVTKPKSNLIDRKSTRLNSSHIPLSRMPSSA